MYNTLLNLAIEPEGNPSTIIELSQYKQYTITLIEHDYAGKTSIMWNTAYKYFELNIVMVMMVGDSKYAKDILENFRNDPKYIGGGSGVGFKDEAVKYLDELDSMAREIGSVNLIEKLSSGKLKGWNTDGVGYAQSLEDALSKKGRNLNGAKIVMLGAGGTGNSIAYALADRGAKIVILNRTLEKAQSLALRINNYIGNNFTKGAREDVLMDEVIGASAIINVSTKGATGPFEKFSALAPAKLPTDSDSLDKNTNISEKIFKLISKDTILSDIILRNEVTPFLKRAHELGFDTLDGIPMVINQGVEAFVIIHGGDVGKNEETRNLLRRIMKKAAGL